MNCGSAGHKVSLLNRAFKTNKNNKIRKRREREGPGSWYFIAEGDQSSTFKPACGENRQVSERKRCVHLPAHSRERSRARGFAGCEQAVSGAALPELPPSGGREMHDANAKLAVKPRFRSGSLCHV